MSTGIPQDDIQAFYDFLGKRFASDSGALSPEESVQEFHAYQNELNRFTKETQTAVEQSERGESRPLDVDALLRRVQDRLANSDARDR